MNKESPENLSIDQTKAQAGGHVVAGDQNNTEIGEINLNLQNSRKTKIDRLLERLQDEIAGNEQAKQMIDDLQYYHNRHAVDGIDGLENKLNHSGRGDMVLKALRRKEAFNKKLEQFVHYSSAQEIFALLLSKVDLIFETEIEPNLDGKSIDEITKDTKEKIVDPIMEEISEDIMGLNYNHVLGMVYWLAEQCFVRWHK